MKTDKQKAKEILRKRKLAAQGLEEKPEGENPLSGSGREGRGRDRRRSHLTEFGLHR